MAKTIPLSVPDDLLNEVTETARMAHLSIEDVFRKSVVIAKPVLRQPAAVQSPTGISVWDALASGAGLELSVLPVLDTVEKVSL